MKATRLLSLALLVTVSSVAASGCVIVADDDDSTLLVVNNSDFVIEEIYLVDVGNPTWGPNLLGGDVLFPDEDFLIVDIECDTYDALLVDETGVECEIFNLDLCFDDTTWRITNNTCSVFGATGDETAAGKSTRATPAEQIATPAEQIAAPAEQI
jgi:hypothetical protein